MSWGRGARVPVRRFCSVAVGGLVAIALAIPMPAAAATLSATRGPLRLGPPPVGGPEDRLRPTPLRERTLRSGGALPSALPTISIPIEDVNPSHSDLDDSGNTLGASGGRTNGLASVAGSNQTYFAATEWGGLYKTTDAGDHWSFVSGHLPLVTWDVEVDPGNTGNMYATSWFDGRLNSVAGIQVSHDGGVTWTHPSTATPPPGYSCSATAKAEPTAFGIAVRPDATQNVAIGTNCGVAISTNAGLTWTFVDPTPATTASDVWDVTFQAGGPNNQGIIDVCGADRHRRSVDAGATWTGGSTQLPAGQCSIAASPDESYVLFATVGTQIFESDDGGATWPTQLTNPGSSGRIPFVATNQRSDLGGVDRFSLWFGDLSLNRADCTTPSPPGQGGAARCPTNTWVGAGSGSHPDAGDVVFDPTVAVDPCPTLFTSDGGVYRNTDTTSDCQNPDWDQPTVTPHATWVYGMDGANQAGDTAEDLYFSLQDDGSYASTNAGATTPTWSNRDCCDAFNVVADSTRVVSDAFSPYNLYQRGPGMTGGGNVATLPPNVPQQGYATFNFPDYIAQSGPNQYIAVSSSGAYITNDITANPVVWTQIGASSTPAGGWCAVHASVSGGIPTFYAQTQCIGVFESSAPSQIWKYSGTNPNGTWTRVDNNDGITGGFGIFAVDPNNPNRLYASNMDPAGPQMIFSNDGGLTWDNDTELDTMMTGGGTFLYQNQLGPTSFTGRNGYAQPSLVAFDPEAGNVLVAGGRDSGVFLSTDAGATWGLLTDPFTSNTSGTPHLPRPWFAYFDHEPAGHVKLYVGTQGRGVWRLSPPSADVSISKTDSPDPVIAGQQLYYTVTVTNNGPDDAVNVKVVDTLPAEVAFVTDDRGVCTEGPPGTLTCDLGDIPSGGTSTVVIKVAVDPSAVAEHGGPFGMTNTATVTTSGSIDSNLANNTAQASTIVEDSADLKVTKSCKPDGELDAGETATCTIFVDNLGPSDARDVVLTDVLTAQGSFTIGDVTTTQGSCSVADHTVTCDLGVLQAGGRVIVTVDVTADEATDINDVATVSSATPDPDTSNNQAEGSIKVRAVADVGVVKSDSPDPLDNGTVLTYTLEVSNSGPSTAVNVVVTDHLPAGVSILSVSSTGGSCNAGVPGDPFLPTTCTFDSIPPGGSETMTIVVNVDPGRLNLAHDDASVSADTFDPNNSNNLDTEDTTIAVEDLQILKSSDRDVYKPSSTVQYIITVTNNGPADAQNVVVTDNLPPVKQAIYLLDTAGCTKAGLVLTCNLGTINGGSSTTFSVYVRIKGNKGLVSNTASVASSTFDWKMANNTSTRVILIKGGV